VGLQDDFFDLGGDSLTAARVVALLEREVGRPVPPALLFAARRLGQDLPSYVIRWTGDPDAPGLPRRIEQMAADGIARLRGVQAEGPYRLAGFCFGGVVAFEMARQLRSAGEEVAFLALIGVSPYDFPPLVPPAPLERYRRRYREGSFRERAGHHRTELSRRKALREKLRYLVGRGRSAGSFVRNRARSAAVRGREGIGALAWAAACRCWELAGRPVPARLRDARRISDRAFAAYVPHADPGPVVLFLSQKGRERYSADPLGDFRGLSTSGVIVNEVPCDDGSMLIEPNVAILAGQLRTRLRESETLSRVRDARA